MIRPPPLPIPAPPARPRAEKAAGYPAVLVRVGLVTLCLLPFAPFIAALLLKLLAWISGVPLEQGGPTTFLIALFLVFLVLAAATLVGGVALLSGLVLGWMRSRSRRRLLERQRELEERVRPGLF